MSRSWIESGSPFEAAIGYARAVVDGDWIFVSGTTGFDYATMRIAGDVAAQAEQALRNIDAALREAGASLDDVVRVLYVLPRIEEFEQCWPVLRAHGRAAEAAMKHGSMRQHGAIQAAARCGRTAAALLAGCTLLVGCGAEVAGAAATAGAATAANAEQARAQQTRVVEQFKALQAAGPQRAASAVD